MNGLGVYPFTAIVGQEEMKEALVLNTVYPEIGGVLIRGEKGTAKSTTVRALADLLPDREVLLQFDGECVILRRPGPSGYEAFLREARCQSHDLLRLHYYDGDTLCTKICADKVTRCLAVENLVDDPLSTTFGVNTSPTWEDLENFLEERCVPRQRDGLQYYLRELGLDHYDPLAIVRKTQGRMAEDNCWLDIVEG